ncbi:hypothetical protein [Bradyrhizobium sp. NP1]|uniref:hypothetical protein n=1 Tax=Bradyrhizobium sp. NP1 TaxID=3049772 RepID=UPI0025A5F3B9|nr:hypothetical protein [Bradyrhizobium sp. NP1]WJR79451.1 hypothetical protein QOU61_06650 [Bradyrhizobium sp. NP1]
MIVESAAGKAAAIVEPTGEMPAAEAAGTQASSGYAATMEAAAKTSTMEASTAKTSTAKAATVETTTSTAAKATAAMAATTSATTTTATPRQRHRRRDQGNGRNGQQADHCLAQHNESPEIRSQPRSLRRWRSIGAAASVLANTFPQLVATQIKFQFNARGCAQRTGSSQISGDSNSRHTAPRADGNVQFR